MSAGPSPSFLDALTAPYSGLRRSVVDPETGNAVVTSADALGDPNDIVRRSGILPIGQTREGRMVPAGPAWVSGAAGLLGSLPDVVPAAIDAARFPGRAARGEVSIFDPRTGHVSDEAMGAAGGIAGLAMTGSLPFSAPKGALRIFGGRNAATADLSKLGQAAEMEAKGAFPSEIHGATGWHVGPDQLPRFEISDDAARLTPFPPATEAPLGLVLDHPELYRAYPEMRDVRVQHRPEMGRSAGANPDDGLIALNLDDRDALSSLLHEGQHIVQGREGFARGGSPADFTYANSPLFAERRASEGAVDTYRRLAGEVEARNVQGRRSMSPLERADVPPWYSQDVPDADQIVRLGNTANAQAPTAALPDALAAAYLRRR